MSDLATLTFSIAIVVGSFVIGLGIEGGLRAIAQAIKERP